MPRQRLPAFIRENYEIHEWRHGLAILQTDFAAELAEIVVFGIRRTLYSPDI